MDPEIADLMGIDDDSDENQPGFGDLFGTPAPEGEESVGEEVDLSRDSFPEITELEGEARPFFTNKDFYKQALGGEGEPAKRFHKQISLFMKTEDPQERTVYRGQLMSAFWNLAESIVLKSHVDLPDPKRITLRFGAVLPKLISPEQRAMLQKVIFDNTTGEPVHYLDEWFNLVARGEIGTSATDEIKKSKPDEGSKIKGQLEKARGNRDAQFGTLTQKLNELEQSESQLRLAVDHLLNRSQNPGYPNLKLGYGPDQKSRLSEITNVIKAMSSADREIDLLYERLDTANEQFESLRSQAQDAGVAEATVDASAIQEEFNTIKQMAKLCVGRQGNHQPVLMKQYFRASITDIGTRENCIIEMAWVEKIDPGVFERTFKRQTNRIVPYVVLVPCYGDLGICWEPFERLNRATSRGRIAIPMFPKDLKPAVVAALGDLRWQVAKEKAQHYWMEEGLTGQYFQWFEGQKRKGDVREAFIQDYILWITKESEGMQKLDKDVRPIFWRHIPFNQEIKDNLKNRGFVYSELYKRDQNRQASDGY